MHELTGWSKDLTVEVAGRGVVAHTGSVALRVLADRMGLSAAMSSALARRDVVPVHDRGRVLADAAVMIADGGRVMSDLAVLRDQGELFGPVASDPTLWRTLDAVDARTRDRLAAARARTRRHVWSQITARHGAIPASKVADRDLGRTIVVRLDATLVIAHSEKDLAAGTFKGTWGHHPLTAWCDNTGESLAVKLRTGSAGSNTVADHLEVLTAALTQIPGSFRRDLLITCDGAGATKDLLAHITTLNAAPGRRVGYSVGFDLDERCRTAIGRVPEALWENVISHDGSPRDLDDAGVVELTGLLRESVGAHGRNDGRTIDQLKTWPKDMRVIVRRERPHPGAQLSLFDTIEGFRHTAFITNQRGADVTRLELRQRQRARAENVIRDTKATGLSNLPFDDIVHNDVWMQLCFCANDLLAWAQRIGCVGQLRHATPKTIRHRLLHVAAAITPNGHRLHLDRHWPWTTALLDAIHRVRTAFRTLTVTTGHAAQAAL